MGGYKCQGLEEVGEWNLMRLTGANRTQTKHDKRTIMDLS